MVAFVLVPAAGARSSWVCCATGSSGSWRSLWRDTQAFFFPRGRGHRGPSAHWSRWARRALPRASRVDGGRRPRLGLAQGDGGGSVRSAADHRWWVGRRVGVVRAVLAAVRPRSTPSSARSWPARGSPVERGEAAPSHSARCRRPARGCRVGGLFCPLASCSHRGWGWLRRRWPTSCSDRTACTAARSHRDAGRCLSPWGDHPRRGGPRGDRHCGGAG